MEVRIIILLVAVVAVNFANGKPIFQVPVDPDVEPARESELMDYLVKYGYLGNPNHRIGKVTTMEEFKAAVRRMQRYAGLNETGDFSDPRTLALVKAKRCGVSDLGPSDNARRKRRYALQGTYWRKNELTYRIENYTPDIPKEEVDNTIAKAIDMWSSASGLTIKREDNPDMNADIRIQFVRGFHGDTRPADGPGAELAHAFFPGAEDKDLAGDVHIDDDDTFAVNGGNGIDLLWLAVHELGHSLGLDHTYHPDSVMFAYYTGYRPDLKLDSDDIQGVQRLYGLPGVEPETPSPNPTPKTCSDVKPDAVVTTADQKTYAFSGKHFWEIKDTGGASGPYEIKEYWPDLEENMDAAYTITSFGQTIFHKGNRFWVYHNKVKQYGPADISQLGLPEDLANIDAALEWRRNGKTYFFKGSNYWRYDRTRGKLDEGYPRPISVWKGIPNDIDAVFQWKNGRSYFFKGNKYYAFDDDKVKVLEDNVNPYPRDVASYWMGCSNPSVEIEPVGSAYGLLPNLLVFIACFFITVLF